jgi:hypothetical protein
MSAISSPASIVALGAINTRFLVPVFVPVVILGADFRACARKDPVTGHPLAHDCNRNRMVVVNVAWFAGRAIG